MQFQEQPSHQTLHYRQYSLLEEDPSRQALENYKSMLRHQGSSKHLLGKFAT